jgi:hypothetical protein
MRLSLFILGVFAAIIWIASPALAQYASQSERSISVRHSRALEPAEAQRTAAAGIAGSQRWNNAWPTCAGLAGTADPSSYPSSPQSSPSTRPRRR